MRIFILGANGHTGTQIVDLALERGHDVTAFVRSPSKVQRRHARLSVVGGDPLQADSLAGALAGHDAVISALGVRPPTAFRPHTVVQACAASTVAAMTRSQVSRLLLVSAAVLFPLKGLSYAFFRRLLAHIARDLGVAARRSCARPQLDWTIARPPRLVGKGSESYRSAVGRLPDKERAMSFRAVAAFLLDAAEHHTHGHEVVGLSG